MKTNTSYESLIDVPTSQKPAHIKECHGVLAVPLTEVDILQTLISARDTLQDIAKGAKRIPLGLMFDLDEAILKAKAERAK